MLPLDKYPEFFIFMHEHIFEKNKLNYKELLIDFFHSKFGDSGF